MKVTFKGPKAFDPKHPCQNGVDVLVIDRGPGEVVITAKRAKRSKKRKPLTATEKTFVRKRLREQGYEGPWGEGNNGQSKPRAPGPTRRKRG